MTGRKKGRMVARIPLTIEATGSGQKTEGAIVAVMVSELDALEKEYRWLEDEFVRLNDDLSWYRARGL